MLLYMFTLKLGLPYNMIAKRSQTSFIYRVHVL